MRPILLTALATFGAAAVISACDRSPPEPQTDVALSHQPAASAVGAPPPAPPHAGAESSANPPLGDMTRQKESEQMPRALDGNNHSSPNTGSTPAR